MIIDELCTYLYPDGISNVPNNDKWVLRTGELRRKESCMSKYIKGFDIGGHSYTLGGDFRIKRVIFNDPATIVLWEDGTKTVVKCMDGDTYSEEIGLAMCICKKALGDKFHRTFTKWVFKDKGFKYKVGDRVKFTTSTGVREGVIKKITPTEYFMPYKACTDEGAEFYLYESLTMSRRKGLYSILGKVKKEGK